MKKLVMLLLIISYTAIFAFGLIAIISVLAIGNPYDANQLLVEPYRKLQPYKKIIILIAILLVVWVVALITYMYAALIGASADRKNKISLAIGTIVIGGVLGVSLLVFGISCLSKASNFMNNAKYTYTKTTNVDGTKITVEFAGNIISSKFARIWGIYLIGSSVGFLATVVPGAFLFFIQNDNNYHRDEEELLAAE